MSTHKGDQGGGPSDDIFVDVRTPSRAGRWGVKSGTRGLKWSNTCRRLLWTTPELKKLRSRFKYTYRCFLVRFRTTTFGLNRVRKKEKATVTASKKIKNKTCTQNKLKTNKIKIII